MEKSHAVNLAPVSEFKLAGIKDALSMAYNNANGKQEIKFIVIELFNPSSQYYKKPNDDMVVLVTSDLSMWSVTTQGPHGLHQPSSENIDNIVLYFNPKEHTSGSHVKLTECYGSKKEGFETYITIPTDSIRSIKF